jgi:hypothetical protein
LSPLVPCDMGFEGLPVLNFRFRSFVGSTRDDQSDWDGGTSIHSSRWAGFDVFGGMLSAGFSSWSFTAAFACKT